MVSIDREQYTKEKLPKLAKMVEKELPEGFGFCLMAFEFGDNPERRMMYISNADRQDIVKAMMEWIVKTSGNNYGKDVN